MSGESPLSGSRMVIFLLGPDMVEREKKKKDLESEREQSAFPSLFLEGH